jgi:penicillin-binding protein 1A
MADISARLDWKRELSRAAARFRRSVAQTRLSHAVGLGILLILGLLVGALAGTLRGLPFLEVLQRDPERIILLEAADGQALARKGPFKAPDKPLKELPPHLIDAVVSIEDQHFYTHNGVDLTGILRALSRNIRAGEVVEGGSTITQQLAKVLYLDRGRTLTRKIREFVLAVWLEMNLSKEEILTRYLNNVYLGAGATGVPAAAQIYFGKDASELALAESAVLAGLIVAPSHLNPRQNPDAARARAALVLDAMVANGVIDEETAKAAKDRPIKLIPEDHTRPSAAGLGRKRRQKRAQEGRRSCGGNTSRAGGDASQRCRRGDGWWTELPEKRVQPRCEGHAPARVSLQVVRLLRGAA